MHLSPTVRCDINRVSAPDQRESQPEQAARSSPFHRRWASGPAPKRGIPCEFSANRGGPNGRTELRRRHRSAPPCLPAAGCQSAGAAPRRAATRASTGDSRCRGETPPPQAALCRGTAFTHNRLSHPSADLTHSSGSLALGIDGWFGARPRRLRRGACAPVRPCPFSTGPTTGRRASVRKCRVLRFRGPPHRAERPRATLRPMADSPTF